MVANRRPASNKLLSVLREDAYRRLEPKLRRTHLHARQILYRPNQAIGEVYFPEGAVICLMTVMANGDTVEAATVGLEGASWISASIGASSMPCETIVAIAGEALGLDVDALDLEMRENEHFRAQTASQTPETKPTRSSARNVCWRSCAHPSARR